MAATYTVGTGKTYSTCQAAIDAIPGNLSGQGIQTVEVYAGGTVVANGWRYDENLDYITGFSNIGLNDCIELAAMEANQGLPGYGIIINAVPVGSTIIIQPSNYSELNGFCVTYTGTHNDNLMGIRSNGVSYQTVHGCIFYHLHTNNGAVYGICDLVGGDHALLYNNMVCDLSATVHAIGIYHHTSNLSRSFNNTITNLSGGAAPSITVGIAISTCTNLTLTNNYVGNSSQSDFLKIAGDSPVVTYCISSDDTADDWGGAGNLINKAAANQFVNATVGSEDLHLKAGADCLSAGTDLSGTFMDDIDGDTRSNWDAGADEKTGTVASPPPFITQPIGVF